LASELPRELKARGDGFGSLRYAWLVVFILMLCYALSLIDRQILSLLVGVMKRDLHISDTRVGLLQGLSFAIFYTLAGLPLGRIADTYNRRNLITVGVVAWSIMTAACSAAKNFWALFFTRMGVGIGEATLSPAAFSTIADYFPPARLGLALSTYSMGIYIGSGLALIVGGAVVQSLAQRPEFTLPILGSIASWRATFLLVGLPGLLIALLVRTVREPVRRSLSRTASGEASKLSLRDFMKELRARARSVAGISLGMVFQSACGYSFLAWGPTFLQRCYGWTPGHSGRTLGILTLVCGCLGMYSGGSLCDYWQRLGLHHAPLRVGVFSAAGTVVFFPAALLVNDPAWTTRLLVPAIFLLALPIGCSYAALQLIFPNQLRGQISALFLFILSLGGLSLGPLVPGLLTDYFFHNEQRIGSALALTIGFGSVLMGIIFWATYRPYRKHFQMARISQTA
jgi:MFS family permease